ncbi:MAG TPA: PQQ-binding-like beta-propeller repeat protein [Solirubrobacterales bacterium]|nr:PQQ-binding-like beta-propeller repeat protein [Solirubrobacterales bacterium]
MSMLSKFRGLALLGLALAIGALAAGCGSSSSSSASSESNLTGDGQPNIDLAANREAKSQINSGNVSQLKEAWSVPIEGQGIYGSYASTPLIINGVVYSQDLESNVSAIDLESGDVIWETKLESPSHGPNGLAVAEGRVYGTTNGGAFALDQKTGKELWLTQLNGPVDMAPGVNEGKVYASTVPENTSSEYEAGTVGTLWAMDAKTGKKLWHFDTVPKDLWGEPDVNSGGGLWYPPSFDAQGNLYAGTGNPAPLPGTPNHPWGSSRPGDNRYADSLVKLNPDTGKLDWFYQETPHNIYDWDFQNSPIITESKGRKVAIGSGKSGFVVAVDLKSGKVVWRDSVGEHNGHDEDGLYAMRHEYDKIKTGEVFPGELGGVIAAPASDGERIYVPIVDHSMTVRSGSEVTEESSAIGEVYAIDLRTGKVAWEAKLPGPAYGSLVVSNDVVFATSAEGVIHALSTNSGGEIWQAALPSGTNAGVMVSGDMLLAGAGLPVAEGQAAKLVAYKLGG